MKQNTKINILMITAAAILTIATWYGTNAITSYKLERSQKQYDAFKSKHPECTEKKLIVNRYGAPKQGFLECNETELVWEL
ncbi:TMhelix containing protein [Vibrio crassostreae]|uniref:Uncharacterized protein n=1 Tax=Vibrio crassostreae TaxID=246167 RepID=A0A822MT11_9VIBR|nr:hypothetical protein [Vibrio crassostreae]TCN05628.1 hypothetical protein EDB35_116126 [Vibrio crassostreae]CAK2765000.1 TMhelix containing protein [Vibrio crassostreae]CAK2840874.1 TMhelix containing protein [Vibrio crassostreae]CAK3255405.1 TMhelix containing protein [Vibrio crassostreae]CDT01170.1 exported hypothetical protein [Vibrio crassostreae]